MQKLTIIASIAMLTSLTYAADNTQEIRRNVERIGSNWTVKTIQPSRTFLDAAKITLSRLKDVRFFEGPTGWIGIVGTDSKGKTIALYMDQEARYVMAGMVVDTSNGMEMSRAAVIQLAPAGDLAKTAKADIENTKNVASKVLGVPRMPNSTVSASELMRAEFIQTGQTGKVLYVFFDPFDPAMRDAWTGIRPQVQSGKIIVRWIPVSRAGDASFGMSAGMIGSKQPLDALLRQLEGEGFRPTDNQIRAGAQSANSNTRLANQLKASSFPVWATIEGTAVRTTNGAKGYADL